MKIEIKTGKTAYALCSKNVHPDAAEAIWKWGAHGERGARAYKGVWGRSPQLGPGAEPLVRRSGGEAPWSWKVFKHYTSKGQAIFAPLPNFWKWAYSTQKIHTQCVREREQTELSHSQCIWCTKPHCPQSLPILENSIFSGLGSL